LTAPTEKAIGAFSISVDSQGWPRWTRIRNRANDQWFMVLNEEEARDLHYALTRIVDFLDDAKRTDISRGVIGPYG
jgi:hypothetical protein